MNNPLPVADRFDELVRNYYRAWFRFHPESAVELSVPGYAHLLTPCSTDDRGALVCLNDELRVELEQLDAAGLDADRRVDCELLLGSVQLENQYLLDVEPLGPDPQRWLPINAIYQLTIRHVEDLESALAARLRAIPGHLGAAQAHLSRSARRIPPNWVASSALAAHRGAEFLLGLDRHPKVMEILRRPAVKGLLERAATALKQFGDYLQHEIGPHAQGNFACGPEYFAHLLRHRHFLDVGIDELHEFGERLFRRTQGELQAACEEYIGDRDLMRSVRAIQGRHPAADQLLAVYRERMRAARDFVAARGLVTLPEREHLEVVETPVFMRHEIPFAAYCEPTPTDPTQTGYYYVTPPADAEQLAEHDDTGLAHTCVHEAYPGHHLQFVTANLSAAARTLPRLLHPSATLYEGWALYAEQLMHEEGFISGIESRIVLLRDRLWRALRVLLDIELHTRGLALEQAADRMVAALGFPRSQALADLAWYTRAPTVPLGYATGWALISATRDRMRAEASLKSFHDRLLSAGSIAAPLVIRRVFGEEAWRGIAGAVFGQTRVPG